MIICTRLLVFVTILLCVKKILSRVLPPWAAGGCAVSLGWIVSLWIGIILGGEDWTFGLIVTLVVSVSGLLVFVFGRCANRATVNHSEKNIYRSVDRIIGGRDL
jgi:hypothetical protein